MADAVQDAPAPPRHRAMPLVLGAALACALGGGAFAVVYSGLVDDLLPSPGARHAESQGAAFVEIAPLTISLGPLGDGRVLRFAATLEVAPAHAAEVAQLKPRLLDVLNSYLRALEPEEFGAAGALIRMRAQILRRMQVIAGEGRVRDLLITEFVVN